MKWNEFPACIDRFGDLFSVFETLDQHRHFNFESFPDHAEDGAYTVECSRGKWVVVPRVERMPGLDRLLELLEREGQYTLTFDLMREIRRRTMNALGCDRAGVNAMTFSEVADSLEAANRHAKVVPEATPATASACVVEPVEPVQIPKGVVVYPPPRLEAESLPADLRDSLEAAWYLVGHTHLLVFWLTSATGMLSRTVRAIENQGTPQERIVEEFPPILTVTAEHVIEAVEQVDRDYLLCAERLRTTRNRLIASGDAYEDGSLHAPCAHDAALKFAHGIRQGVDLLLRITPKSNCATTETEGFLPITHLRGNWEAFLKVLPSMLTNFEGLASTEKLQATLVREAVKAGVTLERLSSRPTEGQSAGSSPGIRPVSNGRPTIVITDDGSDEVPIPESRMPHAPVGSAFPPARSKLTVPTPIHRARLSALSVPPGFGGALHRATPVSPPPPEPPAERIEAAALQLCEFMAGDEFGWADKDGERLILADVAQRGPGIEPSPFNLKLTAAFHHAVGWLVRAKLVTLEILPRDRVMKGPPAQEDLQSGSTTPIACLKTTPELRKRRDAGQIFNATVPRDAKTTGASASNKPVEFEDNVNTLLKGERKEGGRPKLGEGPKATQQEKALRNVYELIRGATQPGWGPTALHKHFRDKKDFKERVKEAGKEFGEGLFKAALAWIKENPNQET